MNRPARAALAALATVAFVSGARPAGGGEAPPSDEALFGEALTAERGERLRLAAKLDPEGWPALRDMARQVAAIRSADVRILATIAKIDEVIAALAERLRPELRRAPLDALEAVAISELKMLRTAELGAAKYCAVYLWLDGTTAVALRRSTRAIGREAELARLRAISAARAHNAVSPAYYSERVTEEQALLRAAGLTPTEIATAFAEGPPPGVGAPEICRATIRYIEAVLDYPATLRATTLAYRLSGDYGYGSESEE